MHVSVILNDTSCKLQCLFLVASTSLLSAFLFSGSPHQSLLRLPLRAPAVHLILGTCIPDTSKIKNPQSALLSNHEVLLHLRQEEAEYVGTDGTGRERKPPSGLSHMLRDVSIFVFQCVWILTYSVQGLAYLQTADYNVDQVTAAHPSRPMTLYKGPHSLFRALAPKYQLNKAEYLQLYNLRPSTGVALELIIEEVCVTININLVKIYEM
jgi:hypothetical protein